MSDSEIKFWDAVDHVRERDPAYARQAYGFVVAALGVAVDALPPTRRRDASRRHLSGQELLGAVIALARREFGTMAPTVFHEWGLGAAADVGRIVFQLVEAGQLSARPEDTMDDFLRGPDLLAAVSRDLGTDAGLPRRGSPGPGGS